MTPLLLLLSRECWKSGQKPQRGCSFLRMPCLVRWRWKLKCPSMLVVPMRFVMAVGGGSASGFRSSVVWASRGLITTVLGIVERPISPCVLFFGSFWGSAVGAGVLFRLCLFSPCSPCVLWFTWTYPVWSREASRQNRLNIFRWRSTSHIDHSKKKCDPKKQLLDEICCACLTVQKFRMCKWNMFYR